MFLEGKIVVRRSGFLLTSFDRVHISPSRVQHSTASLRPIASVWGQHGIHSASRQDPKARRAGRVRQDVSGRDSSVSCEAASYLTCVNAWVHSNPPAWMDPHVVLYVQGALPLPTRSQGSTSQSTGIGNHMMSWAGRRSH